MRERAYVGTLLDPTSPCGSILWGEGGGADAPPSFSPLIFRGRTDAPSSARPPSLEVIRIGRGIDHQLSVISSSVLVHAFLSLLCVGGSDPILLSNGVLVLTQEGSVTRDLAGSS